MLLEHIVLHHMNTTLDAVLEIGNMNSDGNYCAKHNYVPICTVHAVVLDFAEAFDRFRTNY